MTRRYYSSTAQDNTISSSMDATQTTVPMTSALVGWPTQYPFTAVIDQGTASEELVVVTNVPTGTTYPITRAQDGTSGHTHTSLATFKHVASARDFDEPNAHIQLSAGVHGLSGGDSVAGTTALGLKATDTAVVHLTGNETIAGTKTFSSVPVIPDGTLAQVKVTNLVANLATITTNVSSATGTANTAATNASAAVTTANNASSTASSALTNASAAQSTANGAATNASAAVAALSWNTLSLAGGFSAFGSGYGTPQYAKDQRGIVHLRGVITNAGTTGNSTQIATVASGYRPSATRRFPAYLTGTGTVQGIDITTGGAVNVLTSAPIAAGATFALDGIVFDTAS